MLKYFITILIMAGCSRPLITNEIKLAEKIDTGTPIKQQIDFINNIAAEGDIIFRGGTDIESNIIRDFSYQDKLFSHSGILIKEGNKLMVTHILGGSTNPQGSILSQPIQQFLSYPDNESAGIYTTGLSKQELIKVSAFLDSLKKINVTFDLRFNLFTKQQLYCTEVLIDALCFAKKNNKLFLPTSFNLKNTKYFFLANKGNEFLFYPIDVFQHHRFLKKKAIFYFPNYEKR